MIEMLFRQGLLQQSFSIDDPAESASWDVVGRRALLVVRIEGAPRRAVRLVWHATGPATLSPYADLAEAFARHASLALGAVVERDNLNRAVAARHLHGAETQSVFAHASFWRRSSNGPSYLGCPITSAGHQQVRIDSLRCRPVELLRLYSNLTRGSISSAASVRWQLRCRAATSKIRQGQPCGCLRGWLARGSDQVRGRRLQCLGHIAIGCACDGATQSWRPAGSEAFARHVG